MPQRVEWARPPWNADACSLCTTPPPSKQPLPPSAAALSAPFQRPTASGRAAIPCRFMLSCIPICGRTRGGDARSILIKSRSIPCRVCFRSSFFLFFFLFFSFRALIFFSSFTVVLLFFYVCQPPTGLSQFFSAPILEHASHLPQSACRSPELVVVRQTLFDALVDDMPPSLVESLGYL